MFACYFVLWHGQKRWQALSIQLSGMLSAANKKQQCFQRVSKNRQIYESVILRVQITLDEKGNLINAKLTKGNQDDRSVVPQMTADMTGFLFADKGYISRELFLRLLARGLKL
ncbi:MAG: transposase, partial [Holosporaceae bacterium]|nr:transposase [Holosporaceae bacterium]